MNALLQMEDIVFSWSQTQEPVLRGADLTLSEGQCLGILGGNGSGKTTLLHLAAGLLKPQSGRILHQGQECRTEQDFARMRRSLGYVLQHSENQLFCPSVLEDVAFGPLNQGMDEKEALEMAQNVLKRLYLDHLAERAGSGLSGGEQKLAALATVLSMRPHFLFLDEPTNNLDSRARTRLCDILAEEALPMLVISHDRGFLESCCTGYLCLEHGRLCPLSGSLDGWHA